MRITAFSGSPRKGGNTEVLLEEAIRGTGRDVEVVWLNDIRIYACQECGGCDETGVCVIDDDMPQIIDALRASDRIILVSPVFFMGVSAQAKAMIDRCQQIWCEKYLLKKEIQAGPFGRKGLFITVGGMKMKGGVECAALTAKAFFRTISVPKHDVLSYRDVDAKGAIRKHPTALAEAFKAGQTLVKTE